MSYTQHMIDEQVGLLKSRGYDEENLNSPNKTGFLALELAANVRQLINENLFDPSPVSFEISTAGFFNNDSEIVFFKFKYALDVEEAELKMTGVTAAMFGKQTSLRLKDSRDLPQATDLVSSLRKIVRKVSKTDREIYPGSTGLGL